jgi:cytochrome c biogenesis protein CcmG, thiol:disulfide interchange protein DsbE
MGKQWVFVGAIVLGLVLGGAALVWYGPDVQQVAVGARAPDYRTMDLATGDTVGIRDHYRGHVTLVNIWATWCVPCRVEMPAMQRLYDSLSPRGFRIAAVSIDQEGPDVVRDFAASLKLTFDILQDRKGDIQQAYQTTGVPESFLLDTNGVIMKRVIGAHDWSAPVNTALVHRLLGDPEPASVQGDAPRADSLSGTR